MTSPLDIDRLYREYGHMVLRRARSILGNETEAQEVLQEVFLSLMDRPSQFGGRSSFATFLYRMTTNNCLNRIRNAKRRGQLLAENRAASEGRPGSGGDRLLAQEVLASLPRKLASVAVHYYIDEMTHEEIADVMGCSRRMVGKWVEKVQHIAREQAA
jgi:RNA polymerase sigma-70 factor (ECF subfamily)